jgi:DNA-binding GntR family transcriptional regulator
MRLIAQEPPANCRAVRSKMNKEEEVTQLSEALGRRASIPDEVAHTLRELILFGKFEPGQRLVETRFARQLGIGQPAVREALRSLMSEGLVVHQPNRGYSVTVLNSTQVDQIFQLRAEWEPLAVDMAIENRSQWRSHNIENIFERLDRAARKQRVEDYYRHDLEFHHELWRLSGNQYLVRALSQIVVPYFAFCMVRHVRQLKIDLAANAAAHERMMRALLRGERAYAKQVARETIELFRDIAEANLLAEKATSPPQAMSKGAGA